MRIVTLKSLNYIELCYMYIGASILMSTLLIHEDIWSRSPSMWGVNITWRASIIILIIIMSYVPKNWNSWLLKKCLHIWPLMRTENGRKFIWISDFIHFEFDSHDMYCFHTATYLIHFIFWICFSDPCF